MSEGRILTESVLSNVAGGSYQGPCIQYTVVKGDSLAKIARRYGTTVELLTSLNHIRSNKIYIGQVLLIPALVTV